MRRLFLLAALATLAVASPAGAAWTPPHTLARGDVHDVAAASADGGLALAAWRVGGRSPAVAVRMRTGGGEWRPVARFRRPGRALGAPSVAIDARGGAVLAWSESRAGRARRVVAALRSPAGRWRSPRIIGRTGKAFPAPAAAIARNGEAVVVWRYDARLQAAFRRAGRTSFGAARFLGRGAHQRVAYDAARRAHLVYAPLTPGPVAYRTSAPGRRRFGPRRAVAPAAASSFPDLALAPDGTVAVAWRGSAVPTAEDFPGAIAVAVRAPGGPFGPASVVSGDGLGDSPSVAIAPGGEIVAAWHRLGAQDRSETLVAWRDDDPPAWAAPVVLGEAAQFDRPQVAWDARGRAIAAWLTPQGLRAATFPAGPSWTPAATLATRAGYWPVMTKGPHVLAAWTAKRAVIARSWSIP